MYRKNLNGYYEFAIFQRADNELWWQGICGGVEEGLRPLPVSPGYRQMALDRSIGCGGNTGSGVYDERELLFL